MHKGPRITPQRSCSHLVIPGPALLFPACTSRPGLLTVGIKLAAAGGHANMAALLS
jgi:hypothetical protein